MPLTDSTDNIQIPTLNEGEWVQVNAAMAAFQLINFLGQQELNEQQKRMVDELYLFFTKREPK